MLDLKNRIKAFLNYPKQEKHNAIKPEIDRLLEQIKNFRRLIYITPYAHNKIAYEVEVDWYSIDLTIKSIEFLNEDHFEVLNGFVLLLGASDQFLQNLFEFRVNYRFILPDTRYPFYLEEMIRFNMLSRHRILNWKGDCLPEASLDLFQEDINNLGIFTGSDLSTQLIQDYVQNRMPDNISEKLEPPNTVEPEPGAGYEAWSAYLNIEPGRIAPPHGADCTKYESDGPIPEDEVCP
jgi:hypothetical protein